MHSPGVLLLMASSQLSSTLLTLTSLSLFLLSAVPSVLATALHPPKLAVSVINPTPPSNQEGHQAAQLAPILANLGFQELAMAVPALLSSSPAPAAFLSGPLTLFAPSDDSVRSCGHACSAPRLLREHLVPGLFTRAHLSKLAFATKFQTAAPARCLTLTSNAHLLSHSSSSSAAKIFVDGVEITRPDLYNDGHIVIHGLEGFVSPLSPLSCDQDLPGPTAELRHPIAPGIVGEDGSAIVRLMLRDAIVRLRDGGFSILALAMRVKYPELSRLTNMTVFALDDDAIFAGGHAYVTSVRFHVVPDRLLMHADLARLPAGTVLPTLVPGQHLVVTHTGAPDDAAHGPAGSGFRINYVPLKVPDVVYNSKIAIHAIFLPFPHLYVADTPAAAAEPVDAGGVFEAPAEFGTTVFSVKGSCPASAGGKCSAPPAAAPAVHFDDDGF